jgi:iron complex outermembrane receptor protein
MRFLTTTVSALALLSVVSAAHAQDAASTAGSVETVIVTGTRSTSRTVASSLAPIDVLSSVELLKSGRQSPRDLIATLVPSATASNSGAGASFAVKTVSLRGLAADQTLVLVNGKRRHNTAILFVNGTTQNGQSPPDVDLIPSAGIDHIEVLRDGASAQYGSDALAGVINIILKHRPSGGYLSVLGGSTFDSGGTTYQGSGNIGTSWGKGGSLNLSFDMRDTGYTDRGKPYTGVFFPLVAGKPDPREATVDRNINHPGAPAIQLYSLGYDIDHPLGDSATVYAFGTFTSRDSRAWLTPRLPGNSANIISVYPTGYSPKLRLLDHDYQTTVGVNGMGSLGFDYDLSTSYSEDHVDYRGDSINASLGPLSPTKFFLGALKTNESTTNLDLTRPLKTGLFEKPLFLAIGLEYRWDLLGITAGDVASYIDGKYVAPAGALNAGVITQAGAQGVGGFPPFSAGTFTRNNISIYVSGEQPILDNWDVSLAGRFEHYSDFGDAETYKASTRYEPIKGFAIRGTVSTGFKAPSLQQETYASASTIGVKLPGDATTSLYPVQLLPPNTAAAQALGATPLQPEKSTNYSLGLVMQPLPRATLTIDAYQIDITGRILQTGSLGPAVAVSNALRAAGLNPQQAVFYYTNGANTRTQGIDIVADYRHDFGAAGQVKWTFSANFNKTQFLSVKQPPAALAAAGLVLVDRVRIGDFTVGNPNQKFIVSTDWTIGRFDTTLRFTGYGQVKQTASVAAGGPANDEIVSAAGIVDLDTTITLSDQVSVTLGANNLLNKYPNAVAPVNRGATAFTYSNQYSPYGITGGFYYGRVAYKF